MMCPTAARLYLEWAATATPLKQYDTKVIAADRDKPEYQAALEKYKEHWKNCVECRRMK